MRKSAALWIMIALFMIPNVHAMRCGGRLVAVGDSKGDVLVKCGEPTIKDTSASKSQSTYRERTVKVRPKVWVTKGKADSTETLIETWTYNMGEGRMTQILTFENGVLIKIESGDYGSGPPR